MSCVLINIRFEEDSLHCIGLCFFSFFSFRVVGGLLSTYDLSGDKIFLEKAKDIADRLLPAWNTPTGIPYNIINLRSGSAHNPSWAAGVSPRLLSLSHLDPFKAVNTYCSFLFVYRDNGNFLQQLCSLIDIPDYVPKRLLRGY